MGLRWWWLVCFSFPSFATDFHQTHSLHQIAQSRINGLETKPKYDLESSFFVEAYVPFQSFRYQFGFDEETKEEGHTLRIDLKSFKELSTFKSSRRISKELLNTSELEVLNQNRFDAYMAIVQQVIYYRMIKLFGAREKDLNKVVEQSSQLLGLSKINVKDLINELNRLHKVSSEGSALKVQANTLSSMELKEIDSAVDALIAQMQELGQGIARLPEDIGILSLKRQRLELDLERINQEVNWADDRKFFSHVDLRHDTDQNENSFRINFNIPWVRFDNENYAREKVLHRIKEQDFIRDSRKIKSELERKRYSVQALAAQGESTRERHLKTKQMMIKLKKVKDVELRRAMGDFSFELEREVLVVTLKFYTEYLEYLLEAGLFAKQDQANFLDPSWLNEFKAGS